MVAWHLNEISGTNTVIRTLLHHLNPKQFEYWIIIKEELAEDDPLRQSQLIKRGFRVNCLPLGKKQSRKNWLERVHLFFRENQVDLACYFDINIPSMKSQRDKNDTKIISLIHDVMPLILPDYYLDPLKYWLSKCSYNNAIKADGVITVSDYSKNEIVTRLKVSPSKIKRIYNGIAGGVSAKKSSIGGAVGKDRRGILYLGDLKNRKNVYRLAQAYLLLPMKMRENHPLVIVGWGRLEKKIISLFRKNNALDDLKLLGQHSSTTNIFNSAYPFVFPSIMEGFGLPVIEAQRHHLPVICGKHSSLEEIGGNSVYYADVLNDRDLAEKIKDIIAQPDLYQHYADLGYQNSLRFTGEKMALEYQKVFDEL